jgi:hypothetical protein
MVERVGEEAPRNKEMSAIETQDRAVFSEEADEHDLSIYGAVWGVNDYQQSPVSEGEFV